MSLVVLLNHCDYTGWIKGHTHTHTHTHIVLFLFLSLLPHIRIVTVSKRNDKIKIEASLSVLKKGLLQ